MSSEGSPSSPQPKWYVQCTDTEIRGPCDVGALRSLLDASLIDGRCNVWCEGMDAWGAISAVDELRELLSGSTGASAAPAEPKPAEPDRKPTAPKAPSPDVKAPGSVEAASGGATADASTASAAPDPEEEARLRKREKKRQYLQRKRMKIEAGQWVDSARNLSVYVSGLPDDTTAEEVASVFRRAGVIKIDPITTLPKIRLYTDEAGRFKNDARVTFVNKESVDFAIRYFDNYHFREDCVIHVEQARYEPQKHQAKPAVPITAEEMRKRYLAAKYEQDRLQSWTEDVDDGSGRRIVICKPMFSAEEAWEHEAGSQFYEEIREDVVAEITKFVPVDKVTPIARHPQGIVCVKLKNSADAEIFIAKFQGRVFDGNPLEVYFFDGKTDLQAQALPSKTAHEAALAAAQAEVKEVKIGGDWIDEQSSDEEFEIKTE